MIPTKQLRAAIRHDDHVEEVIALEMLASLPIPILRADTGSLTAAAFYFAQHYDPHTKTAKLYPPTWIGHFSWDDGRLLSLESAEPGHLRMPGDRFTPFTEISYATIDTAARAAGYGGAVARSDELDRLYDVLVPIWATGGRPEAEAAPRFAALFPTVALPPMQSAYMNVHPAFFEWVGLVAPGRR